MMPGGRVTGGVSPRPAANGYGGLFANEDENADSKLISVSTQMTRLRLARLELGCGTPMGEESLARVNWAASPNLDEIPYIQ